MEMRSGAVSAIQTAMRRSVRYRAASLLAVLAIVLQGLLPGTLAVAESKDIDVSRFICAPSGQVSADAKAALEALAKLLGEEAPEHPSFDGHCPLCTLVQAMPLPEPVTLAAPAGLVSVALHVRHESDRLVRKAQGPPLGSRGPPLHL